jgi:hypothetical protein
LAAFFEKGFRANNTTVNAAIECGCPVMTNLDEFSPAGYEHLSTLLDISRTEALPSPADFARIGEAARGVARDRYGWEQLVSHIRPLAVGQAR